MSGLKIRVMKSPLMVNMLMQWAEALPYGLRRTLLSLKQGVLDGEKMLQEMF